VRLGERLVSAGILTPQTLERALAMQRVEGGFLTDVLVSQRLLDETTLL
jgi:hypothetical protein